MGEYIPKYLLTNTILHCILRRFTITLSSFSGVGVVFSFLMTSEEWGNTDTSKVLKEKTEGPGYLNRFLPKNSAAPEVSWITHLNSWLVRIALLSSSLEKAGIKLHTKGFIYLFVWLEIKARSYYSLHLPQAAYWKISEGAAGKETHENLEKY